MPSWQSALQQAIADAHAAAGRSRTPGPTMPQTPAPYLASAPQTDPRGQPLNAPIPDPAPSRHSFFPRPVSIPSGTPQERALAVQAAAPRPLAGAPTPDQLVARRLAEQAQARAQAGSDVTSSFQNQALAGQSMIAGKIGDLGGAADTFRQQGIEIGNLDRYRYALPLALEARAAGMLPDKPAWSENAIWAKYGNPDEAGEASRNNAAWDQAQNLGERQAYADAYPGASPTEIGRQRVLGQLGAQQDTADRASAADRRTMATELATAEQQKTEQAAAAADNQARAQLDAELQGALSTPQKVAPDTFAATLFSKYGADIGSELIAEYAKRYHDVTVGLVPTAP